MDKPQVDRIEGIPPAIAIDQTNPVRTSRSTVGTMTELNDHLKLLFARAAELYCRNCGTRGAARRRASRSTHELARAPPPPAIRRARARNVPRAGPEELQARRKSESFSQRQGYTRIHERTKSTARGGRRTASRSAPRERAHASSKRWSTRSRSARARERARGRTTARSTSPDRERGRDADPSKQLDSGATPPTCTARIATSRTATSCRTASRSTRRSARASTAADSAARSGSIGGS